MEEVMICLNHIKDVSDFVKRATKIPADIDLVSGRYIIDAKSIMGVLSMDLSNPIKAVIHSDDPKDIELFKSATQIV